MEVPHPFFTHEGLPEGVGRFNVRSTALLRRAGGEAAGDVTFHLEPGLTNITGLHIRNDAFREIPRTEAMFQFTAIMSKDGQSGFAPPIEFEFPTRSEGRRVSALVGQTARLANSRFACNEVVHYDPREDGIDGSAALVVGLAPRVFPVVEVLGEGARGECPFVNVLAGFKVRVYEGILLGVAYQLPIARAKDFSSQFVDSPDIEWTTR